MENKYQLLADKWRQQADKSNDINEQMWLYACVADLETVINTITINDCSECSCKVVAHCLELDIVATGNTVKEVKKEMEDLILTQVDFAFSNDNLDNLYHPAPADVWEAYKLPIPTWCPKKL